MDPSPDDQFRTEKLLEFHLEEFRTLKAEQLKRISMRDMTVYYSLVSLAAVLATVYRSNEMRLLLLVPVLGILLGWIHIFNDQKVIDIRRYIRGQLKKRVQALLDVAEFEWETPADHLVDAFHSGPLKSLNRGAFLLLKLLCFVFPGFFALWWLAFETEVFQWDSCLSLLEGVFFFELICLILLASTVDRFVGVRGRANNKNNAA